MAKSTQKVGRRKSHLLKHILFMAICATLLSSSTVVFAGSSINTVSITADTLEALPSCLHYKIVGMCFWLVCDPVCHVRVTPKVDHYLPDLVVTTYPKFGDDPWFEVNKTIDVVDHVTGNRIFAALNNGMNIKSGVINSAQSSNSDIKFREIDVIGNPALMALHWFFLLKGQAKPYMPYFQSQLDAKEWRSGLLEQLYPSTWLPGKDDVGTFLTNEWGAIYPRQGFIMQPNVGKASAVIAVRGANISTTNSYNHIAKNLLANLCPEKACTFSGAISGSKTGVEWQMLLPDNQTTCKTRIDYTAMPDWTKHQPENQPYSWVVWREYRGCIDGGGIYLTSVDFGD